MTLLDSSTNNECARSHTLAICDFALLFLRNLRPLSVLYACFNSWLSESKRLHLGYIRERKCLYCPFSRAHSQRHTHTPWRARGMIWPSLWAAVSIGSSPRANEGGSKSALPCLPSSSRSVSLCLFSSLCRSQVIRGPPAACPCAC